MLGLVVAHLALACALPVVSARHPRAGFAVALKAKGETVDEVSGLADAMYARRTPISVEGRLLDVVGTGFRDAWATLATEEGD